MKVLNHTKGIHIATDVKLADSFLSRFIGLLNRSSLNENEGLLITRCNSIHMFFMRFPIDVIFLDKQHTVVGLVDNIQPFRTSPFFLKASFGLELKSGTIQKTHTQIGDQLMLI